MAFDALRLVDPELADMLGKKRSTSYRPKSEASLYPTPELSPEQESSLLSGLREKSLGTLARVGNFLDLPGSMVRDTLTGNNPFDQLLSPTLADNRVTGKEMLQQYGLLDKDRYYDTGTSSFGKGAAGFLAEVAFDPLTYMTFGASAAGKLGQAAKGAGLMDDITKVSARKTGQAMGEMGRREMRQSTTLEDFIKYGDKESAAKATKIKEANPDLDASEPLFGSLGWAAPFKEPFSVMKATDRSRKVARGMDWLENQVRYFKVPGTESTPVDATIRLFSTALHGTKTKWGQALAKNIFRDTDKAGARSRELNIHNANMLREAGLTGTDYGDILAMKVEGIGDRHPDMPEPFAAEINAIKESLTPEQNKVLDDVADNIRAQIDPSFAKGKATGHRVAELEDMYARYMPRHIMQEVSYKPARDKKTAPAFDPHSMGRLDIFRDLKGGTVAIKRFIKSEGLDGKLKELNDLVEKKTMSPEAAQDELSKWISESHKWINDNYRKWNPNKEKWEVKKGRQDAVAKYVMEMDPEIRKHGLYANNPIVDTEARRISYDMIEASRQNVKEAVPQILKNSNDTNGREIRELIEGKYGVGFRWGNEQGGMGREIWNEFKKQNPNDPRSQLNLSEFSKLKVNREQGEDLVKAIEMLKGNEALDEWLALLDGVTNFSKGAWTTIWPAFHTRNFISGMAWNFTKGMLSMADVGDAKKFADGVDIDDLETLDFLQEQWTKRTGYNGPERNRFLQEARANFGDDSAFANIALTDAWAKAWARSDVERSVDDWYKGKFVRSGGEGLEDGDSLMQTAMKQPMSMEEMRDLSDDAMVESTRIMEDIFPHRRPEEIAPEDELAMDLPPEMERDFMLNPDRQVDALDIDPPEEMGVPDDELLLLDDAEEINLAVDDDARLDLLAEEGRIQINPIDDEGNMAHEIVDAGPVNPDELFVNDPRALESWMEDRLWRVSDSWGEARPSNPGEVQAYIEEFPQFEEQIRNFVDRTDGIARMNARREVVRELDSLAYSHLKEELPVGVEPGSEDAAIYLQQMSDFAEEAGFGPGQLHGDEHAVQNILRSIANPVVDTDGTFLGDSTYALSPHGRMNLAYAMGWQGPQDLDMMPLQQAMEFIKTKVPADDIGKKFVPGSEPDILFQSYRKSADVKSRDELAGVPGGDTQDTLYQMRAKGLAARLSADDLQARSQRAQLFTVAMDDAEDLGIVDKANRAERVMNARVAQVNIRDYMSQKTDELGLKSEYASGSPEWYQDLMVQADEIEYNGGDLKKVQEIRSLADPTVDKSGRVIGEDAYTSYYHPDLIIALARRHDPDSRYGLNYLDTIEHMYGGFETDEFIELAKQREFNYALRILRDKSALKGQVGKDAVHGYGPDVFYQRAKHVTPHEVDEFDTEFVGTGEGHQAFGWGLYYLKDPRVEAKYKKQFSRPSGVTVGDLPAKDYADELYTEINKLYNEWTRKNPDKNVFEHADEIEAQMPEVRKLEDKMRIIMSLYQQPNKKFDDVLKEYFDPAKPQASPYYTSGAIPEIQEMIAKGEITSGKITKPRVYEVDLKATDEQLMHWDKKLSEQSPEVQEFFRDMPGLQEIPGLRQLIKELPAGPESYALARMEEHFMKPKWSIQPIRNEDLVEFVDNFQMTKQGPEVSNQVANFLYDAITDGRIRVVQKDIPAGEAYNQSAWSSPRMDIENENMRLGAELRDQKKALDDAQEYLVQVKNQIRDDRARLEEAVRKGNEPNIEYLNGKLRGLDEELNAQQQYVNDLTGRWKRLHKEKVENAELMKRINEVPQDDRDVSIGLNKRGVKGIKFFNGFARGKSFDQAEDIDFNFVMFDGKDVEILDYYHQQGRRAPSPEAVPSGGLEAMAMDRLRVNPNTPNEDLLEYLKETYITNGKGSTAERMKKLEDMGINIDDVVREVQPVKKRADGTEWGGGEVVKSFKIADDQDWDNVWQLIEDEIDEEVLYMREMLEKGVSMKGGYAVPSWAKEVIKRDALGLANDPALIKVIDEIKPELLDPTNKHYRQLAKNAKASKEKQIQAMKARAEANYSERHLKAMTNAQLEKIIKEMNIYGYEKKGTNKEELVESILGAQMGASNDRLPRGRVVFNKDDGTAVIEAFKSADMSTLAHEIGHIFRRNLAEVGHPDINNPDNLLNRVSEALGVKDPEKWTVDEEELFASQWEKYLSTGQAPTAELKNVFERFKEWLYDVYKGITNSPLKSQINPQLKNALDDVLGQRLSVSGKRMHGPTPPPAGPAAAAAPQGPPPQGPAPQAPPQPGTPPAAAPPVPPKKPDSPAAKPTVEEMIAKSEEELERIIAGEQQYLDIVEEEAKKYAKEMGFDPPDDAVMGMIYDEAIEGAEQSSYFDWADEVRAALPLDIIPWEGQGKTMANRTAEWQNMISQGFKGSRKDPPQTLKEILHYLNPSGNAKQTTPGHMVAASALIKAGVDPELVMEATNRINAVEYLQKEFGIKKKAADITDADMEKVHGTGKPKENLAEMEAGEQPSNADLADEAIKIHKEWEDVAGRWLDESDKYDEADVDLINELEAQMEPLEERFATITGGQHPQDFTELNKDDLVQMLDDMDADKAAEADKAAALAKQQQKNREAAKKREADKIAAQEEEIRKSQERAAETERMLSGEGRTQGGWDNDTVEQLAAMPKDTKWYKTYMTGAAKKKYIEDNYLISDEKGTSGGRMVTATALNGDVPEVFGTAYSKKEIREKIIYAADEDVVASYSTKAKKLAKQEGVDPEQKAYESLKLTARMETALAKWSNGVGNPVAAGSKTLKGLRKRGLVDEMHNLTEKGAEAAELAKKAEQKKIDDWNKKSDELFQSPKTPEANPGGGGTKPSKPSGMTGEHWAGPLTNAKANEMLREMVYANQIIGKFDAMEGGLAGQHRMKLQGGSLDDMLSGAQHKGEKSLSVKRVATKAAGLPGNKEGTTWKDPRLVRGVKGNTESSFAPMAAGEEVGHYVEMLNRMAPFLNLVRKGYSPQQAAMEVGKNQIQYSNRYFSPFESQVMKRLLPFYSFSSRMMKNVGEELIQKPGGRLGATIRAQRMGDSQEDFAPDYIRDTASFSYKNMPKWAQGILGAPPEGTDRYITGLGLMHEDPFSFGPTVREAGLELLSRSNPFVKAPLEWATGESFFQRGPQGGRDLEDMDPNVGRILANVTGQEDAVKTPGWMEHILANSPIARGLSTVRTATDPRKRASYGGPGTAAVLNLLTGVRVSDVSPGSKEAIARELLEQEEVKRGASSFERVYFRKEDLAKMTPEQREQALQLQALANVFARRAKERKQRKKDESQNR